VLTGNTGPKIESIKKSTVDVSMMESEGSGEPECAESEASAPDEANLADWSEETVYKWACTIVKEEHAKVLLNNEIDGSILLGSFYTFPFGVKWLPYNMY
jgi:hypothetical protein